MIIRMSEKQAQLLFSESKQAGKPSARRKPKLAENDVEVALVGFLNAHGWRCIRLLAGTFKSMDGKRYVVGAPTGIPDWLCIRGREFFLLEAKAPGRFVKPGSKQEIWIRQARQEGIPVFVADDYDKFVKAYFEQRPNEKAG
jgi:hypothetical protein